ncbi:MAG: hypothetical protein FP820_08335 [Sulfurimonas sp.]|nr:hypothetical protein [Sulfurimonas sp.]MBU3939258.1 hypothetical protein [bacterium]MBU4025363.1 hypothetical protein [bacterium]MBU4059838.1 hypothetical protein [bacterium]MBU4109791.1 hypothetical protein [bacterium]
MLDMSKSIQSLDESDISDNLYHYKYNTKHLLSLIRKNIDKEDPAYLSSFRSFEGEVFENYAYEKLLRYAVKNEDIEKFILKGFHQNKQKAHANTLSISEKQQIVYRTKSREISEFDAIIITKNKELYFVEMTLVKSVLKLRKRLRKKKALLEIIFPQYEIKSLIILNDGATGTKQLPSYCKVWITKEFSAQSVLEYITDTDERQIRPKERIKSAKLVEASSLKLHPFRYYNTMSWITKTIRANKKYVIDMNFLMNYKIQRYHDLYNKFYIGYMNIQDVKHLLKLNENECNGEQMVVVALEKKHSDEIVLTYYIQKTRKILYLYSFNDENEVVKEKKDPFGITVTEVYHISKMMDTSYELKMEDITMIEKSLRERFQASV